MNADNVGCAGMGDAVWITTEAGLPGLEAYITRLFPGTGNDPDGDVPRVMDTGDHQYADRDGHRLTSRVQSQRQSHSRCGFEQIANHRNQQVPDPILQIDRCYELAIADRVAPDQAAIDKAKDAAGQNQKPELQPAL